MTTLYTVVTAAVTVLCVATIVCMLNSLRHSRLAKTLVANVASAVDNPTEALAVHSHEEAARSSRSLALTMLGGALVVALAPVVVPLVA